MEGDYGHQSWHGLKAETIAGNISQDGLTEHTVNVKDLTAVSSRVTIRVEYQPGHRGAGAIPEYIEQTNGTGIIILGHWSEIDRLRAYSGGARYMKTFSLSGNY